MMRADLFRSEVVRLLRTAPFQPFVLNLENGDRLPIVHPENIAFDPTASNGRRTNEFYVVTSLMRFVGTFEAVTSIALQDVDAVSEI